MLTQHANVGSQEIGGNFGVAVNSQDQFALGRRDSGIHRAWNDPLRVVEKTHRWVTLGVGYDLLTRAIVAHAVDDKHFKLVRRVVVGQNTVKASLNETSFIAHRHDDREERLLGQFCLADLPGHLIDHQASFLQSD